MRYSIKEFIKGDGTKQYEVKKYWFGGGYYLKPDVEGYSKKEYKKLCDERKLKSQEIRKYEEYIEIPKDIQGIENIRLYLKSIENIESNDYEFDI
jgi:hypothetical protein